jgi:hypothetical protein
MAATVSAPSDHECRFDASRCRVGVGPGRGISEIRSFKLAETAPGPVLAGRDIAGRKSHRRVGDAAGELVGVGASPVWVRSLPVACD